MRIATKALAIAAAAAVTTPAAIANAQGIQLDPPGQQAGHATTTPSTASPSSTTQKSDTCAPMQIVAVHGKSGAEGADTTTDQGLLGDVVSPVLLAANEPGADVTGGIGQDESQEPSDDSASGGGIQLSGQTTETPSTGNQGVAAGLAKSSETAERTSEETAPSSTASSAESSAETTTNRNGIEISQGGEKANVARTYISFDGGREGAFIPGVHDAPDRLSEDASYQERIDAAAEQTLDTLDEIDSECPNTKIAIIGHAEGAQAAGQAARAVGNGESIDPDKIIGVSLLADPSRGANQQVGSPDGMNTDGVEAPEGQGIATIAGEQSQADTDTESRDDNIGGTTSSTTDSESDNTEKKQSDGQSEMPVGDSSANAADTADYAASAPGGDYGELTEKTASFCLDGDAICAVKDGSPLAKLASRSRDAVDVDNPEVSLEYVAGTLAPAVTLGTVEGLADSLDFGEDGFTFNRADSAESTTIGRIAAETERPADPSETTSRLVAAGAKLGGMGLAAGVTVAKEAITPANIAEVVAAGASDPAMGLAVAGVNIAEAAVEADLINLDTLSTGTQRVIDEAQSAGFDTADINDAAVTGAISQTIGSRDYETTPVTNSGDSATQATTGWLMNAASKVLGDKAPESLSDKTTTLKAPEDFDSQAVTDAMEQWT